MQTPLPSYWEKTTFLKPADLLVVGAGLVGLTAALAMKRRDPNMDILVVERGSLPLGASTRNAGFACFGSISELQEDLAARDEYEVFELVEQRWKGLQRLRALVGDEEMSYKPWGGYELFPSEEQYEEAIKSIPYFNERLEALTSVPEVYVDCSKKLQGSGFKGFTGMIFNKLEGQLHPGRMMQNLLHRCHTSGIRILAGLPVRDFETGAGSVLILLDGGHRLEAGKMLIATNGFARRLLPDLEVRPARNQVVITKPVTGLQWKGCFHLERGYYYFRNVGQRVLLGGGRHLDAEGEQTDQFGSTEIIQTAMGRLLQENILPGRAFEIDARWSGILGVGKSKTPIIRMVHERVGVVVRMGGMGVALGSLAGEQAAAMMLEKS